MKVKIANYNYFSAGVYDSQKELQEFLYKNRGKWLDVDTEHLFDNQYNVEGFRIYDTHISEIKDDLRDNNVITNDFGGVVPELKIDDVTAREMKFSNNYQLEVLAGGYYRFRSCYNSKSTLEFIVVNGVCYIRGIGYTKATPKALKQYLTIKVTKEFNELLKKL